jgi:hypothetical protein
MKCLKKLEKEKAAIDAQPEPKKKEIENLNARERKVEEREKRLENKIRENSPESVTSLKDTISVPTVKSSSR